MREDREKQGTKRQLKMQKLVLTNCTVKTHVGTAHAQDRGSDGDTKEWCPLREWKEN